MSDYAAAVASRGVAWRTLIRNSRRGARDTGRGSGCGASGPEDPRPKILGHIGRGARRMTRGGGRVFVCRSVQAVSGFVIRQRPRFGSRAVIPSPRLSARCCPRKRLWGRPSSGRPIASFMGSTDARDVRDHSLRTSRPVHVERAHLTTRAAACPCPKQASGANESAAYVFRWRSLPRASNRERGERNGGSHVEVNSF
jgi:hypothetical protein